MIEEPNEANCYEENREIQIEIIFIGFPKIYDYFRRDQVNHSFSGKTLSDLVTDLITHHGEPIRKSLLEERTQKLDPTIQVRINEKFVKGQDFDRQIIEKGDKVVFLRLLAGG